MTKKKKIIIISAITAFVILMGVLVGLYVAKNSNKNNNIYSGTKATQTEISKDKTIETLTEVEKEIAGIDTSNLENEEDKKETYSDLYKEYLKLPEEEKEKTEVVPRKQEVPFEKLEEIKEILEEDNQNEKEEDKIPERFNLAEKIDIKVENQSPFGLCWDFASIKTLETYLALNNLGNYDLSEMHVDYITSQLMYGGRQLHNGGSFGEFQDYVVESGVVLEEQVPFSYKDYSEEEYSKFPDIAKVVEVTETVDFPSMYKSEYSKHTDEEIAEFRETVKKHIMKNGGLYTSVHGTGEKNYYAAIDTQEWSNHAVTIVGWDDNYSKDNFLSSDGKKPSKDGAYICLNSWGTFYNDGGYYYVSYEDKYIESNLSGIVSTSMDSAYKIDSIENPVLKEYLKKRYGTVFVNYNGEDYITKNALSNIRTLDLSNSNLTSLEGIEIFSNVYDINLSNNNIKDITPLTKLTSLSSINLANNNITDISAFSNMKTKSLYSLNLSNNKIKDVSALNEIIYENEWSTLNLDISNNPNIKGYEKLTNIWSLDISDCNIKDVSNLKNCEKLKNLKIANTTGIKGLDELPDGLYELDISNCEIDALPELNNKISSLNISKNNITTLNGIQKLENLYNLDVSENPIIDWSALKEITRENSNQTEENEENTENNSNEQTNEIKEEIEENEEYYDDYYEEDWIYITANNCNIEDITIFNDLNISATLYLKDNKIKDVSQFHNEKVYYIDLSNNKDLTGLRGLSKVSTLFLNDCNISDISELALLENIYELSLENNNITDITELSKLKNLASLSLAGNKELRGTIVSENIYNFNVSDCNLDNNFDFSKMTNLLCINISKNPDINDLPKIVRNKKDDYLTLIIDELDFEDLEKIKADDKDKNFYIKGAIINLNYKLSDNENKIDLSQNKLLKRELRKNLINGQINIDNGHIEKNGYIINIDDLSKDSVEIKLKGFSANFSESTIKIIFNPNAIKPKKTNTNTNTSNINTSTNTSNIIENNTINTVNVIEDNNIITDNTINNNTNLTNTLNNTNLQNNLDNNID